MWNREGLECDSDYRGIKDFESVARLDRVKKLLLSGSEVAEGHRMEYSDSVFNWIPF